jgi:hypothetical protein
LPDFRLDKISDIARGVRAILSPGGGATAQGLERAEEPKNAGQGKPERRKSRIKKREFVRAQRDKIKSKKAERSRIRKELGAATQRAEVIEHMGRKKRVQQEIFELESELRAVKERRGDDQVSVTGALPDFVVIGAMKGGTSFFYYLLGQHPLVQPAASKELHFFDALFEQESVEWYRQCFPAPRWEDGRRTITGEASPYMAKPHAPERMAGVVPEARLIALLRNPVERAYSDYQMVARKDREHRTFEEAIEWEMGRPLGGEDGAFEHEDLVRVPPNYRYLSRSRYAEHLLRWAEFFPREQMLVLKSEDFFDNPRQTLKSVFSFLDLPEWELQALETPGEPKKRDKRNVGRYEEEMDPATRRRLEEYFEPHNQRLYDFLGVDFEW